MSVLWLWRSWFCAHYFVYESVRTFMTFAPGPNDNVTVRPSFIRNTAITRQVQRWWDSRKGRSHYVRGIYWSVRAAFFIFFPLSSMFFLLKYFLCLFYFFLLSISCNFYDERQKALGSATYTSTLLRIWQTLDNTDAWPSMLKASTTTLKGSRSWPI